MKVIGNIKWTDNLATWQKRLPRCPIQNHPQKLYEFPYKNKWSLEKEERKKLFKELCSLKIGGINFELDKTRRYEYYQLGGKIYDVRTYFLKELTLSFDDKKDSINLYDIFKNKYDCSRDKSAFGTCYSEYSKYSFGLTSLTIKPTSKSIAILRNKSEKIYRSEVGTNNLDPNDF